MTTSRGLLAVAASLLAAAVGACAGTELSSNGDARRPTRPNAADAERTSAADDADTASAAGAPAADDLGSAAPAGSNADLGAEAEGLLDADGDLIACPRKAQRLLILDFKSGWWAGDGGRFFEKVLN